MAKIAFMPKEKFYANHAFVHKGRILHQGCRGLPYIAVVRQVASRHHLLWLSLWSLHSCSAYAFISGLVCFYPDPFRNQLAIFGISHATRASAHDNTRMRY